VAAGDDGRRQATTTASRPSPRPTSPKTQGDRRANAGDAWDDDQIVPYADSAPLSVKLLKHGTLKTYEGLPHGMCTTHPEVVNPDLLAWVRA